MKNKYKTLPIPKDSAWVNKNIFIKLIKKLNIDILTNLIIDIFSFFRNITTVIKNLITWFPVILKDRNWDHFYIYAILEKKLFEQRKYIVTHNRFTSVDSVNKYITICLNLINIIKNDLYGEDFFTYYELNVKFVLFDEKRETYKMESEFVSERFDEYILKNKKASKLILLKYPNLIITDTQNKFTLCSKIADYKKQKAKKLLFKILEEKIEHWWD